MFNSFRRVLRRRASPVYRRRRGIGDFGLGESLQLGGNLLFSIITTARVSQIEIKYHRPLYEPRWLIEKERSRSVPRERKRRGMTGAQSGDVHVLQPTGGPYAVHHQVGAQNAVNACLSAVPSGEACCSTDSSCADPSSARCGSAGCVDMPDWDVSLVTDMEGLFPRYSGRRLVRQRRGQHLRIQPADRLVDTARVTSMRTMFMDAARSSPIGSWNTHRSLTPCVREARAFNQPMWAQAGPRRSRTCIACSKAPPRSINPSARGIPPRSRSWGTCSMAPRRSTSRSGSGTSGRSRTMAGMFAGALAFNASGSGTSTVFTATHVRCTAVPTSRSTNGASGRSRIWPEP